MGVVVLFLALGLIAVSMVEVDGGGVRLGYVKTDRGGAGGACWGLEAMEELGGDAALAVGGGDFKSLNVGDGVFRFARPLYDGEGGHLLVFFGNPGGGGGTGDELLHVAAG